MLSISKPSQYQLDIELSGPVDTENMRAALDRVVTYAQGMLHGRMLYKVSDFEMPSLGALAVEFQMLPKLFGVVGRFEKCAVVSDADWIRRSAEIKGAVIPSLQIKSFPMDAADQAQDWLDSVEAEMIEDDVDMDENYPV